MINLPPFSLDVQSKGTSSSRLVRYSVLVNSWLLGKRCCIDETLDQENRSKGGVSKGGASTAAPQHHPSLDQRTKAEHNIGTQRLNRGQRTSQRTMNPLVDALSIKNTLGEMHHPRGAFLQNVPCCSDNMWLLSDLQHRQSLNSNCPIILCYVTLSTHTAATITNTLPWGCCLRPDQIYNRKTTNQNKTRLRPLLLRSRA